MGLAYHQGADRRRAYRWRRPVRSSLYDAGDDLFIYNLSTKDSAWLPDYTYGLEVLIDGARVGEVYFSLR